MKTILMINIWEKHEFSNNFINVGASTIDYNENIVASFSNYGQR